MRVGILAYVYRGVFATHYPLFFPSQSFWGWLSICEARLFYLWYSHIVATKVAICQGKRCLELGFLTTSMNN
jgi:hypothetical protein